MSHGRVSASRKRWRLSRYSAARSRASERPAVPMVSLAAIEPRWLDQKDSDSHRIDKKPAGIGEQVFPAGVEHADHQCSHQRALQAAKTANRDHDQEQHEVKNR